MGIYGKKGYQINPFIYNLTKSAVIVYTNDGNFIRLLPADFELPSQANNLVMYIVSKEMYEDAKKRERSTFDLLCVSGSNIGRHSIEFRYLDTYDSLETPKVNRVSPCTVEIYNEKDPNGLYHQNIEE